MVGTVPSQSSESGEATQDGAPREFFPALIREFAGGASPQLQSALNDALSPFHSDHDGCVRAFTALTELVVSIENIAIATAMHADNQRLPGAPTVFEALDTTGAGD